MVTWDGKIPMIYEYRCPECKGEMSIERAITDQERSPSCFDCHVTMIRKWAAPNIQFKGKGFYSTDK